MLFQGKQLFPIKTQHASHSKPNRLLVIPPTFKLLAKPNPATLFLYLNNVIKSHSQLPIYDVDIFMGSSHLGQCQILELEQASLIYYRSA